MDYFTGLIRRTGLVVDAEAESERPVGDRLPWEARGPDAAAQLEMEGEKLVSPSSAVTEGSDEAAAGKVADSPLRELRAVAAEAGTTRLPEADTSRQAIGTSPLLELENSTPVSALPESQKPTQAENDAHGGTKRQANKGSTAITEAKGSEPSPTRVPAEKPFTDEPAAKRKKEPGKTAELMKPEPLLPRSALVTRTPGKPAASGRKGIRGGDVRQEQVLRTVQQQVRDWVSREPVFTTVEQRSQATAQMVRQIEPVLRERSREGPAAFPTGRAAPEAKPGGEGLVEYNVQVAVGPVSVTIEQPEPRAQGAKPPAPGDSRPASGERSSRLSRRYLHL